MGALPRSASSEAPLPLHHGLLNPDYYSKYQPFGVLFEKKWVYEQGGRPVIYVSTDYDILPEDLKWRHVRYEPPGVDFTWEREWKIPCWELPFDPGVARFPAHFDAIRERLGGCEASAVYSDSPYFFIMLMGLAPDDEARSRLRSANREYVKVRQGVKVLP